MALAWVACTTRTAVNIAAVNAALYLTLITILPEPKRQSAVI
jgi:hypothetical protein